MTAEPAEVTGIPLLQKGARAKSSSEASAVTHPGTKYLRASQHPCKKFSLCKVEMGQLSCCKVETIHGEKGLMSQPLVSGLREAPESMSGLVTKAGGEHG